MKPTELDMKPTELDIRLSKLKGDEVEIGTSEQKQQYYQLKKELIDLIKQNQCISKVEAPYKRFYMLISGGSLETTLFRGNYIKQNEKDTAIIFKNILNGRPTSVFEDLNICDPMYDDQGNLLFNLTSNCIDKRPIKGGARKSTKSKKARKSTKPTKTRKAKARKSIKSRKARKPTKTKKARKSTKSRKGRKVSKRKRKIYRN